MLNQIEEARTAIRDPSDIERSVALGKGVEDATADRRPEDCSGAKRESVANAPRSPCSPGMSATIRSAGRTCWPTCCVTASTWSCGAAQFDRYGSDIWLPLRDTDIPIRRYPGADFPEFFETMSSVARRIDADAIYVSKPRFPGLGVGVLAKELWNRALILDIDDFEPSFFNENRGLDPNELRAARRRPGSRACPTAGSGPVHASRFCPESMR